MKSKTIAIFMFLLLVVPALVCAELTNLQAKGTDMIDGYVRQNDFVEITVTARIDGDSDITPSQVVLKNVGSFESCNPGVSGFDCSLRIPPEGTKSFAPTLIPFAVELYDDSTVLMNRLDGSIAVDNNAPVIKSFSITPETTITGKVVFNYNIEDYAFSYGDTRKCSGIEKIEFYESDITGTLLATEVLSASDCSLDGKKNYTTTGSGTIKICAKAYDAFMQGSNVKCDTFLIDNQGPGIIADSLKIMNSRDNEISHFSDLAIDAVMSVDITGDDLDKQAVSADVSELNPGESGYESLSGVCGSTSDSITRCVWNFVLEMSSGGAKNIVITALDNFGNQDPLTVPRTFTYDNTGPVVNSIKTSREVSGVFYATSSGNTFIADIKEDGAGLDKDDVLLHVGSSVYSATNCSVGWTCNWNNVGVYGAGTVKAYIGTDSKDVLGNAFSGEKSIDVVVDNTKPTVNEITIHTIGGTIPAYQGYTKTGDRLQIIAKVSDVIYEAYADLSSVITDAEHVIAECNTENETTICVWNSGIIDVSGYINDYLNFYFVDAAGNIRTMKKEIVVYGLLDEENPNYWRNTVKCTPSKVDRQVTPLINQRVYCHVDLSPLTGAPVIMSIDASSCWDSYGGNSENYIEGIDVINNVLGSTDPYIKLALKRAPMDIDRLDITCSLKIKSKVDNFITQNSETENVSIGISLYDMPLGEFSKSTKKKIDDAKNNAWVRAGWIGSLNKIINYADKACSSIQVAARAGQVFKSLGILFDGVSKALLPFFPPVAEGVDKTRMGEQSIGEALDKVTRVTWSGFGNKYCKAISCRLFYDDVDWMPESIKKIGSWQRDVLDTFDKVATLDGKIPGLERGMAYYAGKAGYYKDKKPEEVDQGGYEQHLSAHLNPKESFVLSAATLCLPGIIYNLDKYRQIECMYADCIESYAKQGLPLKVCEDQKCYGRCKYFAGEIFQLMPVAPLMDSMTGLIKQALSSPVGVVDITAGLACSSLIAVPYSGALANVCLLNNIAGLTTDVAEDIGSYGDKKSWEVQGDYCSSIGSGEIMGPEGDMIAGENE